MRNGRLELTLPRRSHLVAFDLFLALHAICSPGESCHALWRDGFFTIGANTICTVRDPRQCEVDELEHGRVTVQISRNKLTLRLELDLVDGVSGLFDRDA